MGQHELSLLAVFLTGLLGGVHCAGMCGGIVSALGLIQQQRSPGIAGIPVAVAQYDRASFSAAARPISSNASSAVRTVALYNAGRLFSYTALGALAGAMGSIAWLMQTMLPIQQTAYLISNLLLITMGLYLSGFRRIATVVEGLGNSLWKRIRPAATQRLHGSGAINSLVAGALWGLVPCGMVYAVLGTSLVSGSAGRGAFLMFIFGLGTLPNLMILGMSGNWLARASKRLWVRRFAGLLVLSFGFAGLLHLSMMSMA